MIYNDDNFPDLPRNWASLTVDEAVESAGNSNKKLKTKDSLGNGRFPVVDQGQSAISGYSDDESLVVDASESMPVILFGDHTRIFKRICHPFVPGADGTKLFHAKLFWDVRFVYQMLRSIKLPDKGYARHYQHLRNSVLPLPPLPEQKRIADKLDTVLARVDACRERLNRVPLILKRFRQSVLAAATSGQLTADWRKNSVGLVDKGNSTIVDDAKLNLKPNDLLFDTVDVNDRYQHPAAWISTTVGQLATLITSGSRGWADYYSQSGATFIRAQNINRDKLDLVDVAFVALPREAEGKRSIVELDDLLITITGANVGKSARVHLSLPEAYVSQHVALIKLKDKSNAKFLEIFCWAENAGRGQLNDFAYGGGKPGLNLQNIKDLIIGIPDSLEQQEIVRRAETLFAFADRLEARLATARTATDRLTPALLAKAFRGELVPQDPNDEPAAELLKRLAAARTATSDKPRRGRAAKAGKRPSDHPSQVCDS